METRHEALGGKENLMKTVIFRGPALTQSGYGQHARMVCRWLLNAEVAGKCKLYCQLLNWGETPWIIDSKRCDGLIGELMKRSVPFQGADVSIQLQLPNEWDPSLASFNVGMTAAVETDVCNSQWVDACNRMNLIIVPSEHTKRTLTNSGKLTTQVIVIPESFPDSLLLPISDSNPFSFDTTFNFLIFGQITGNNPENDRKNIFYTVKWLCETFKDNPDVGIVVKTNHGRNSEIDRNFVTSMMTKLMKEVRKDNKNPPLHLIHGELSDSEIQSLVTHESMKAMVNLTHGEGFGLPMLEAAACGLPIIATNWSAHTEFLNLGKWVQIDYQLGQIHQSRVDDHIFVKNARWAFPSEENFKKRIKKFYNSSSIPKEWAKDLKEKIIKEYSFENVSKKYDTVFKEIL